MGDRSRAAFPCLLTSPPCPAPALRRWRRLQESMWVRRWVSTVSTLWPLSAHRDQRDARPGPLPSRVSLPFRVPNSGPTASPHTVAFRPPPSATRIYTRRAPLRPGVSFALSFLSSPALDFFFLSGHLKGGIGVLKGPTLSFPVSAIPDLPNGPVCQLRLQYSEAPKPKWTSGEGSLLLRQGCKVGVRKSQISY